MQTELLIDYEETLSSNMYEYFTQNLFFENK